MAEPRRRDLYGDGEAHHIGMDTLADVHSTTNWSRRLQRVLAVGVALGCALLMPVAFLGAAMGIAGLARPSRELWGIDVAFFFLGAGGMVGFPAFLIAEFAPRAVRRAGVFLRAAILVGLAWGSLAALCLGVLSTMAALVNGLSLQALWSPAFLTIFAAGLRSWRNLRRDGQTTHRLRR